MTNLTRAIKRASDTQELKLRIEWCLRDEIADLAQQIARDVRDD